MTSNVDKLEALKMKLKSATKLKLSIERDLCKVRDRERSLNEELAAVKTENDFLKEQIEDLKSQIAQTRQQISMIEICSSSEKNKLDAHTAILQSHRNGFQVVFDKEREVFQLRMKEIQNKEAEEEAVQRQKDKEIAEKKEQEAKEAAIVEAECQILERECRVIKKRNNAIMLKLRRKLMETENARRELAKKKDN